MVVKGGKHTLVGFTNLGDIHNNMTKISGLHYNNANWMSILPLTNWITIKLPILWISSLSFQYWSSAILHFQRPSVFLCTIDMNIMFPNLSIYVTNMLHGPRLLLLWLIGLHKIFLQGRFTFFPCKQTWKEKNKEVNLLKMNRMGYNRWSENFIIL